MIVALAFCQRDQDVTLKLAEWIEELGGAKAHKLLLCHDARCPENVVQPILERFQVSFERVLVQVAKAQIDGWPAGANYMFRTCCDRIKVAPFGEFLWLEPDAVPLKPGWLDAIEAEYKKAGKPFMGDRVEVENVPVHLSGIAVYQNPIYEKAGECYRAHDVAWDMAGKDQILPNAHFTKLIEHAWKHPSFTNLDELKTQIRPEAVLFHSSKDGSLIDLLRQNLTAAPVLAEPATAQQGETADAAKAAGGEARESTKVNRTSGPLETRTDSRGGGQYSSYKDIGKPPPGMFQGVDTKENPLGYETCDIFIRTYPKDYQWLAYSLQSIQKFASGFRKIVVVSTEPLPARTEVEWIVTNDESPDGYLAQQITKIYADVTTNYEAHCILHIDSDVIFTKPVSPQDFFVDGKIQWLYTPYSEVKGPWKPITEKFMNRTVEYEFMRRFPLMIPKWLYPKFREFAHKTHGIPISDYIRNQPLREFSEFNALGAYAFQFHHDQFSWLNTVESPIPPMVAKQYFSWNGINEEVKKEIETILSAVPGTVEMQEFKARKAPDSCGGAQTDVNGMDGSDSGIISPEPGAIATMPLQPPVETCDGEICTLSDSVPLTLTPRGEMLAHIMALNDYAQQSVGNRIFVMQRLGRAGLKSKRVVKRRRKKRARAHSGNVG